jgi:ATP-dependent DNA ligase
MLNFGAKPKPLTVPMIFENLKLIAQASGTGSQQHRVGIIKKMLVAAKGSEAKFIIRHCQGKLRIGMSDKTLLVACAHAFAISPVGPDGVGVDVTFKVSGGATRAPATSPAARLRNACTFPPGAPNCVLPPVAGVSRVG